MDDAEELDLAYITLYSRFIGWLEPYSEGQHDNDALKVYRVFAGTDTASELFEAYAAGVKQGITEERERITALADAGKEKAQPAAVHKVKSPQGADRLEELFETLKEANGITA